MREQILAELKAELEGMLAEGSIVEMKVTEKNNGVKLQTVAIKEPGNKVMPCIHIDRWLALVEIGKMTVRKLAEDIVKAHEESKLDNLPSVVENFGKDMILENVVYQIINKEMNESGLADVPHKDFLDLAAVYRVRIKLPGECIGSMLVTNGHIEAFGITHEELDEAAFKNTESAGFSVRSMSEVIAELRGMPVEALKEIEVCEPKLYVMTNADKVNGAAIMLYRKYFEELANNINDDLYIIPSSIHELLALPATGIGTGYIRGMVGDVNDTHVEAEERLSYSIYKYSRESGELEVA